MIENIFKFYYRNLTYQNILKVLLFFVIPGNLYSIPEKNISIFFIDEKNYIVYKNNFIGINNTIIDYRYWNFAGIYYFLENDIEKSEYCFLKSLQNIDFNKIPDPLSLHEPLQVFLNIIFFYELVDNFRNINPIYKEKQNFYLEKYIDLIQNRWDLAIITIKEIRKRNLSNLEYRFANNFYKTKENHSETFLYEYILTLIHSHNFTREHFSIIEKIQNQSLKKYIWEQIGVYYFYNNKYDDYIYLYENIKANLKSTIMNSNNIFYVENVFLAYYELYKNKKIHFIPEEIYKKILETKNVKPIIYKNFLNYFFENKLLFTDTWDHLQLKINKSCYSLFIKYFCKYQNEIKEIQIQKEILGTNDLEKIKKIKKTIINFF